MRLVVADAALDVTHPSTGSAAIPRLPARDDLSLYQEDRDPSLALGMTTLYRDHRDPSPGGSG